MRTCAICWLAAADLVDQVCPRCRTFTAAERTFISATVYRYRREWLAVALAKPAIVDALSGRETAAAPADDLVGRD